MLTLRARPQADFLPLLSWHGDDAGKVDFVLRQHLLPHLGTRDEDREQKLFCLVTWTRELLELRARGGEPTDRDHMANKRARIAGVLMEELFGRGLRIFWKELHMHMKKLHGDGREMRIVEAMVHYRNNVTNMLRRGVQRGDFGNGKQDFTRPYDIAQSDLSAISIPRQTTPFLPKSSKAFKARQVHPSQYGLVCPAEAPQGDTIGYVKTLAATAEISSQGNDAWWSEVIGALVAPWRPHLDRVVFNGRIVGSPPEGVALEQIYRQLRPRIREDPPYHAIVLLKEHDVVVETSPGRWVRPLYVAPFHHDTHPEVAALHALPPKAAFRALIEQGYLEYVDASMPLLIAPVPGDLTDRHTHVEVHPALVYGHSAGRIPFSNHDAGPRVSFQADMGKQAVGAQLLGYRCYDASYNVLRMPQRPLAQTAVEKAMRPLPTNVNAVVAIITAADNIEDSISVSQRAVDSGMWSKDKYETVTEVVKRPDRFGLPSGPVPFRVVDLDADGIISAGTRVGPNAPVACVLRGAAACAVTYKKKEVRPRPQPGS